jgi:hypothetical protein
MLYPTLPQTAQHVTGEGCRHVSQMPQTPPLPLLRYVARQTRQFIAEMGLSPYGGRDPVVLSPRRIMPDVLLMPTLKVGDPIGLFIQVETNNFSLLTLTWSMWLHDVLYGAKYGGP